MEIDKKTVPSFLYIVLDGNEKYLKKLKSDADELEENLEKEDNFLVISNEGHDLTPDEIYFENESLHISCNAISKEGSTHISLDLPLSQEILFDILGDSIKKFNKIKTIFEATK